MDLLSISRTLWRHKFLTIPLLVLTLVGGGYAFLAAGSEWQAKSTFALSFPPSAVSAADLAQNPQLATVPPDNPYTRFDSQTTVVSILISDLTYFQLLRHAPELAATCVELFPVTIKGFKDAVRNYEVPWK